MANRRNDGHMPAEQGRQPRGMADEPVPDHSSEEDVRGIGESDESDAEFEDTEDLDEAEDDEEDGGF